MARIIKLHIEATGDNFTTQPDVQRFFNELDEDATDTTITISVTDFEDDEGNAATELPELSTDNSYFNVYINGVLQMGDTSTYTAGEDGTGELTIVVPEGETIFEGTPVVLEVVNFTPDADINIDT